MRALTGRATATLDPVDGAPRRDSWDQGRDSSGHGSRQACTVLVAATGGHLQQLHDLAPRIRPEQPRVWITFDSAQSRSLLRNEEVHFVPAVEPRDYRGLFRNVPHSLRLLHDRPVSRVVSTGSGVALAYLPWAAAHGIPTHYVESASRVAGPSVTGRILRRCPGVSVYTQHPRWVGDGWRHVGSIFDDFRSRPVPPPDAVAKVVVVLGTMERFPFRRLVDRLVRVLPPDAEVLWQTGSTPVDDLDIDSRRAVPSHELSAALEQADVIVAHAGTGTALSSFAAGRCPVLVPRRRHFGEHVDDHQVETAAELARRELAVVCEPEDLSESILLRAAARRIDSTLGPPIELETAPPTRWRAA